MIELSGHESSVCTLRVDPIYGQVIIDLRYQDLQSYYLVEASYGKNRSDEFLISSRTNTLNSLLSYRFNVSKEHFVKINLLYPDYLENQVCRYNPSRELSPADPNGFSLILIEPHR